MVKKNIKYIFKKILVINHKYVYNILSFKDSKRPRGAKEKLIKLTNQQFQELSTDVYDELIRRTFNSRGIILIFNILF